MLSISAQVKAANSKLAKYLLAKEEEEGLLNAKKPRKKSPEERKAATTRWTLPVDFRVPSGQVDRPRTAEGGTTFHFSFLPISKTIRPHYPDGSVLDWACSDGNTTPAEHAGYIEGYPLRGQPAQEHAAYVEGRTSSATHSSQDQSITLDSSRVAYVYSNISDDALIRDLYWRQVPDAESEIRTCNIGFNFKRAPEWWRALETAENLSLAFRELALAERSKWVANKECSTKGRLKTYNCSLEEAGHILEQVEALPGFSEDEPPVRFMTRGGRLQYRMVAELPHELGPAAHQKIMVAFCDHLGSLEKVEDEAGQAQPAGMMFTGTIHVPERGNDPRNHHLHVVAHDRRAVLVDGPDGPRFEFSKKKLEASRDYHLIDKLRAKFAEIVNVHLKAAGISRRYDPREYKKMKIDREPTEHLGNDAHALDAAGPHTVVSASNAVSIWRDAKKALAAEVKRQLEKHEASGKTLMTLAAYAHGSDPDREDVRILAKIVQARSKMIFRMTAEREELLLFHLNEAQAKSRAMRTILTCKDALDEIASGDASKSTQRAETLIRKRLEAAQAHVAEIDNCLAAERSVIASAQAKVDEEELELRALDKLLLGHAKAVRDAVMYFHDEVPLPDRLRSLTDVAVGTPATAAPDVEAAQSSDAGGTDEVLYTSPPTMQGKPIVDVMDSVRQGSNQLGTEANRDAAGPELGTTEKVRAIASEPAGMDHTAPPAKVTHPGPPSKQTADKIAPQVADGMVTNVDPSPAASTDLESGSSAVPNGKDVTPNSPSEPSRHGASVLPEPGQAFSQPRKPSSLGQKGDGDKVQLSPVNNLRERVRAREGSRQDNQAAEAKNAAPAKPPAEPRGASSSTPPPRETTSERPAVSAPAAPSRPPAQGKPARDSSAWDAAFAFIKDSGSTIDRDGEGYRVDNLCEPHAAALRNFDDGKRTQGRLKVFYDKQEEEVKRLIAALEKHGRDDQGLVLKDREDGQPVATLGPEMKRVEGLWKKRRQHPTIKDWLSQEYERREALHLAQINAAMSHRTGRGK